MGADQGRTDPLRIVIFHGSLAATGGKERIILEQASGLRKLGHRVDLFCTTLDRRSCYPDLIKDVRPRRIVPLVLGRSTLASVLSIGLATVFAPFIGLRFLRADVFLGSNQIGGWLAFCMSRVLRKPYAVYRSRPNRTIRWRSPSRENGRSGDRPFRSLANRFGRLASRLDRMSIAACSVVIANSDHLADLLKAQYRRQPVVCVVGSHPQSQRVLRFNLPAASDGAFKLGHQIVDKPYLLVTSRHEPQSRLESVVEVLARVREEVPGVVMVITGKQTSHTAVIIQKATELGVEHRLLFTGVLSEADLQRLYREAAVYCHPEHYGGTGLGVVEAMAWGLPVVAWNTGATRVPVDDGKTGFLADPNDIEAFANSLAWLLQDLRLRHSLGAAGWKRVSRYFSWENHARVLDEALRDSIGEEQQQQFIAPPAGEQIVAAEARTLPAYKVRPPEWADAETEPLNVE